MHDDDAQTGGGIQFDSNLHSYVYCGQIYVFSIFNCGLCANNFPSAFVATTYSLSAVPGQPLALHGTR